MNGRQCIRCGKWHNMCVTSDGIEEIIEELQLCRDCLFAGCEIKPILEKIYIEAHDPIEQPIADQMMQTYNYLIKNSLDAKD